jgi:polysaccharide export outer membrane protein
MNKTCTVLAILLSVLVMASCKSSHVAQDNAKEQAPAASEDAGPYTLGPADQITITVWRNTDLGRTATIDPAGNINMPLAGDVKAAGLTVSELKQKIATSLAKYVNNPQVDVNLTSAKSARIHVLGEVKSPGSFTIDHNVMPLEAIAMAGGFTTSANQGKVLLVRNRQGKAEVTAMNLNIRSTSGRESLTTVKDLRSSDIVYVIPTKLAEIDTFMSHLKNILSPFVTVEQGVVLWPQVMDVIQNKTTPTANRTPIAITP